MRHEPAIGRGAKLLSAQCAESATLLDSLSGELFPGRDEAMVAHLIAAGFADPIGAMRRLREWRAGLPEVLSNEAERDALEAILPALLAHVGRGGSPDATLAMLDEIVGRISVQARLFRSLQTRPSLMASLLDLLASAPSLARCLATQPRLVDRMIDSSAYAPVPSAAALTVEFDQLARDDGDDLCQRLAHSIARYRFDLGLQLLEGTADGLAVASAQSDLAEAGLRPLADRVQARMREVHGVVPEAELVILGLGRFGGRSLTHGSDLDLIFLFTGDHRSVSDGRKPLDANEYFSRLAQQISLGLSTMTPSGPLYEVDTRLRPWGAKGLLACSTDSYRRYLGENACTWEHMALTRARPIYGMADARREVGRIVEERLCAPRSREALLRDAAKMRGNIARHKPPRGNYDVKLIDGGLVDLEFTVQVHQLDRHVGLSPELGHAIRALVAAGLLEPSMADAHQLLSRMLISLRLVQAHCHEPAPEQRRLLAQACGFDGWTQLAEAYRGARDTVGRGWSHLIADVGPLDG